MPFRNKETAMPQASGLVSTGERDPATALLQSFIRG
jgi:hypothetical protein